MVDTKPLHLTEDEISELLNIVQTCQSHIQDYDLDEIDEDGEDCTKWERRLTKLQEIETE